jgi:hypothetical protein
MVNPEAVLVLCILNAAEDHMPRLQINMHLKLTYFKTLFFDHYCEEFIQYCDVKNPDLDFFNHCTEIHSDLVRASEKCPSLNQTWCTRQHRSPNFLVYHQESISIGSFFCGPSFTSSNLSCPHFPPPATGSFHCCLGRTLQFCQLLLFYLHVRFRRTVQDRGLPISSQSYFHAADTINDIAVMPNCCINTLHTSAEFARGQFW